VTHGADIGVGVFPYGAGGVGILMHADDTIIKGLKDVIRYVKVSILVQNIGLRSIKEVNAKTPVFTEGQATEIGQIGASGGSGAMVTDSQ
jgi:hypothetical protein